MSPKHLQIIINSLSYLSFQRLLYLLRQHAAYHHLLAIDHQSYATHIAPRHPDSDQHERLGGQRLSGKLQHAVVGRRNLRIEISFIKGVNNFEDFI